MSKAQDLMSDKIYWALNKQLKEAYPKEYFTFTSGYNFEEHLLMIDLLPFPRIDRTQEQDIDKMEEIIVKNIRDKYNYFVKDKNIDKEEKFSVHVTFIFKLSPMQEKELIDFAYDTNRFYI